MSGTGWVQMEGGPKEEIRLGDVVFIPASVKHWHGATATSVMTHAAIAEALDGKSVDWMKKSAANSIGVNPASVRWKGQLLVRSGPCGAAETLKFSFEGQAIGGPRLPPGLHR